MDDHSPSQGEATLTASQLEGHLQLAMASQQQLLDQGLVDRRFVCMGMEAYGLELAPHMPPNAFTAHPSKVNYDEVVIKVEEKVQHIRLQLLERLKQDYARIHQEMMELAMSTTLDRSAHERRMWQVELYMSKLDFAAVEASTDPVVLGELTRIHDALTSWEGHTELGTTILAEESELYRNIDKARSVVVAAIERRLILSDKELAELQDAIRAVTTPVRVLRHVELVEVPSARRFVEQTVQLVRSSAYYQLSDIGIVNLDELSGDDTMVSVVGTQVAAIKEIQCLYLVLREIDDLVDQAVARTFEIARAVGTLSTLTA